MVRFKNRWLLLSLDTRSSTASAAAAHPSLTPQSVTKLLRASLSTNFGDAASGALGGSLVCKYYSTHTGTAIVRCAREGAKVVWAAATLVSSTHPDGGPGGTPLRVRVTHLGGTIKKLQKRAMELDKIRILQLKGQRSSSKSNSASGGGGGGGDNDQTTKLLEASAKAISAVS
ncbi:uncharacterized protein PFL1_06908 [Pseudozyma flocculosa PF-1]|uniref:Uncharacterized protein n=2 Tax=Pseudozyma flocculosa TaxID=84751 RepID=A0A5C3F1Y9_9BASI|nr:uncharacterized protein PFL1_06908 [Pseudozyma flocculosa PF-1]EPQ26530.1 hypothetical protein PFL1_06908 [Pseudozyma flocculosa PF-1]SPO38478.1 uncharacterized protein PSFLO_03956 [Pseudozyma flocculosa]